MEIFGVIIPLWTIFIGVIITVVVAWKIIKFAIKLLVILIIFFVILVGLDIVGVFSFIKDLISSFL